MNLAKLKAWPRKYLWQAPRGWAFKLTRNSDARMRDFIAGKSVVVVGNARSLLSASHGEDIDAADVVVRLNKGFIVDPAAQGHRTDAVGLTPELTEAETRDRFAPKLFLMLIPKMRHFRFYARENLRRTVFYPFRSWLADRNRIRRRPSSGFMAISWVIRLGAARSITLYGFDFGATPTYYNPAGYRTPHNYAREAEIILEWERQGKLTVVRSDQT